MKRIPVWLLLLSVLVPTLARAETISGLVSITPGGAPLAGANIQVTFEGALGAVFFATSQADGSYVVNLPPVGGLPSNHFRLRAAAPDFYNLVYPAAYCIGDCAFALGTSVVVTPGGNVANIDFAMQLLPIATIQGTLTDAQSGDLLADVAIDATQYVDAATNEQIPRSTTSNGSGQFSLQVIAGVPLRIGAFPSDGRIDQIFPGANCPAIQCSLHTTQLGQVLTLMEGEVRTGTDFALSFPGSASGTVFSVTNAAPIAGAVVEFVSTGGDSLRAMTQANGDYSIQMPPGIWSATIEHASSHLRLQWANLPCTFGCPAATGTPIAIAASANTANIDFALTLGGSISGFTGIGTSTTDFPGVLVFAADGTLVEDTGVATASAYRTRVGLPSGEYFVRSFGCATAATGLCVHRIFAFVPCELDCNPLTGDPVGVVAGADTASINLSIHLGCRIRAQVREDATHRELPLARIQVFDSSGALVRDSQVDPETSGYNIDPLRAVNLGQYFVKVSSPAHVDELYDNIACEDGCAVTAGTPVVCNGSFDLNLSISLAPIDEVFASGFE